MPIFPIWPGDIEGGVSDTENHHEGEFCSSFHALYDTM